MKKFSEKPAGIINSADLKTFKGQFVYWLIFILLCLVCVICIVPAFWTLMTGFKTSQEMYRSAKFFPEHFSFSESMNSISLAWKSMDATRASLNTLLVCIGSTLFTLTIDGLGGYVLSRLKPKGTTLVFTLIVWTMMMPGQIRIVPLFMSYMSFPFIAKFPWELNLMNTYWPMVLGHASSAFTVMLFKNNFDSVSISYIEAARLDGCSNARIFYNIMVPLSVPIIIYVAIGTMRAPWGDFFTPYLILTNKEKYTLPVKIFQLKTDASVKNNTYMLCLFMSSIPGFLIFALFQKYIVGGVNVGGVKG
jgi:multiple sugar transport system permease protein